MTAVPTEISIEDSRTPAVERLRVSLITQEQDFAPLREEWNVLVGKSAGSSIFQRHEWISAWWEAQQAGSRLFIVIVRRAEKLRAVAPLCIKQSEAGLPGIRMLQFLGAPAADYTDILLSSTDLLLASTLVDAILAERKHWDAWSLSHVPTDSPNGILLKEELGRRGVTLHEGQQNIAPWLAIPEDPKSVAKSLPKGVRYDLRKGTERLSETGKVAYEVIRDPQMAKQLLPDFFRMLYQREVDAGRPASRRAREWFVRYFSALMNGPAFELVHFSRLSANGVAVAYHIGFKYEGRLYWYKPTFNPSFAKSQPGKLLIQAIIESAVEEKITEFDFLLGDEPYKFQWTKTARTVADALVFTGTLRSRLSKLWLVDLKPAMKKSDHMRALVAWFRPRRGN